MVQELWGAGRPQSLGAIESSIRDGSLLCAIVKHVTGKPVQGWLSSPKTTKAAARNISKCVELLRCTRDIGRRYLYIGVEDDIMEGKWTAILGLLEDLHRWADGCPPRPTERLPDERPYLGEDFLSIEQAPLTPRLGLLKEREGVLNAAMSASSQRYSQRSVFHDLLYTPGSRTPAAPMLTQTPPRIGKAIAEEADLLPQRVMPASAPLSPSLWRRAAPPPGVADNDIVPSQQHISGGISPRRQDLTPAPAVPLRGHHNQHYTARLDISPVQQLAHQPTLGVKVEGTPATNSTTPVQQTPRHSAATPTSVASGAPTPGTNGQEPLPAHRSPLPGLREDPAAVRLSSNSKGNRRAAADSDPEQFKEAKSRAIAKLKEWFQFHGVPHTPLDLLQVSAFRFHAAVDCSV